MSVVVHLPGPLRSLAGGRRQVTLDESPRTVAETLETLFALHPALRDRVVDEEGQVRRHVNVFVACESIRHTGGLATPVGEDVEIFIMPAVSGGVAPGRAITALGGE